MKCVEKRGNIMEESRKDARVSLALHSPRKRIPISKEGAVRLSESDSLGSPFRRAGHILVNGTLSVRLREKKRESVSRNERRERCDRE